MKILKSIWACVAGIVVGVVLSLSTDFVLEDTGILPHGNLWTSTHIIIFVLFYRIVYNILGSYIVAKLAPGRRMRHVIFVGILGTLASALGAIATAGQNLGPSWYAWTLAAVSLPSSWFGGWLYLIRRKRRKSN